MNASLRALMRGLIDYAGLFPPAKLPLDQALAHFAQYQGCSEAWMLGRFICPAARLNELETLLRERVTGTPALPLSLLTTAAAAGHEYLDRLQSDLQSAADFARRLGPRARVEVLETRLPPGAVATDSAALAESLRGGDALLRRHGFGAVQAFHEVPLSGDWKNEVTAAVEGIALFNRSHQGNRPGAGLKLRCGGLDKAAFPTAEQIAFCLRACASRDVPFKATAGLHHPFPVWDRALAARMHGFINVFGGGVLASAPNFGVDQLQAILADDDPGHFQFDDEAFTWREHKISATEIAAARERLTVSFGSCSFDEPRDDLRSLAWL